MFELLPRGFVIGYDDPLLEAPAGKLVEVFAGICRLVHVLQHHVRRGWCACASTCDRMPPLYLLCAEAGAYVQAHAAYCIYFFGDIALLQGIAAFVQNLFKHMRTC